MTKLNLVVIRSKDIQISRDFYSALGLEFTEERHGKGPLHFAAEMNGCVFEIYPFTNSTPTIGVRLGFCVQSIAAVLNTLGDRGKVLQTSDGRVVIEDPDEHKVELTEEDL